MYLHKVVTLYHPTGPLLPRHWAFVPAIAAGGSGSGGGLLLLTDKKASAIYSLDVAAEPGGAGHPIHNVGAGAGGMSDKPMADTRLFAKCFFISEVLLIRGAYFI